MNNYILYLLNAINCWKIIWGVVLAFYSYVDCLYGGVWFLKKYLLVCIFTLYLCVLK